MNILVTGGAGFIGSHLVARLITSGYQVAVVDNLSRGRKENINPKAKFYHYDITSKALKRIFHKEHPKVVFHLAAETNARKSIKEPYRDARINILGSLNVLECALRYGVKRFIFASSAGVYGQAKTRPTPEDYYEGPELLTPYATSKATIEQYLNFYHHQGKLSTLSLRYANVYGQRQNIQGEGGVVAIFISQMLKNEPIQINGSGDQTRDFIYVDDVTRANVLALNKEATGIFNISTGRETSVNELYKMLARILKTKTKPQKRPAIKGEIQRSVLDWTKARRELGWQPRVELEEGLRKTVEWFSKSRNKIYDLRFKNKQ